MLFIQLAWSSPLFYFSWIFTVVVSIILHELAHGWVAIWQGDRTPIEQHRMSPDPMTHMGPYALIMLVVIGIAWGQMPINPYRFRSQYGRAMVAFAGPAMNIFLAIAMLTAMGGLVHYNLLPGDPLGQNLVLFMSVFGQANMALAIFNLVPLPPLDGSAILANFHSGYDRLINDPAHAGTFWIAFLLLFFFMGTFIFEGGIYLSQQYFTVLMQLLG